jgi:hypothetical protein
MICCLPPELGVLLFPCGDDCMSQMHMLIVSRVSVLDVFWQRVSTVNSITEAQQRVQANSHDI